MKGKFIVIEGIDGSGKATQTKKLIEHLRQTGQNVETFSFPRHSQKFFGLVVDDYLNNKFGDATKIDPHLASVLYACDRFEVRDTLSSWLKAGKTLVLDRYATSNMGHQMAKIKKRKDRDDFLAWLHEMEYDIFKIPKPDIVFYLDVDVAAVVKLMSQRGAMGKEYINGDKDAHERNIAYLNNSADAYLYLCGKYDYWQRIKCVVNGRLLTIDEIHNKIWNTL